MNFNTRPRGFHAVIENSGDDDPCKALARQTKPEDTELTFQYQGRHFRLTDVHGNVLKPLLG